MITSAMPKAKKDLEAAADLAEVKTIVEKIEGNWDECGNNTNYMCPSDWPALTDCVIEAMRRLENE